MSMSLKLSKGLFFFILIFSVLAFGTTEHWSYAIMQVVTGIACLLLIIDALKNKKTLYHVPGITPLLLFLLYILAGIVPLPPVIVKLLSPSAFNIHQTTQSLSDISAWMTLSVHPKATVSEFFRYATYVMFYALTVQLLAKKERLKSAAFVIIIFGGLLAFSSILQFYLTDDMALWFRHSPVNAIVVGPYVNHNHYAGLMEMIFPVILGIFLFYRPRIGDTGIIKGIAEILSQEKANIHILIGASALLVITSIFVSLSRGAIISTCMSLVIFTYLLLRRRISRGNTTLLIAIVMLTALSIGWFGWDQIFERFAKLKTAQGIIYEARLDFWKDTVNIIKQYTLTGSGSGTFASIYPLFRTFQSSSFLFHAHNDYLELLAESGIIGFILAACFFTSFFYKTYTVFKKRRDGFSIYLYIGSVTAITAILFHSFVDFNLHVGANGLWFFFICGLTVSAANTGLREQSKPTRLSVIASDHQKFSIAVSVFILVLLMVVFNVSNLLGTFYYSNISRYIISANTPAPAIKKIDRVADYAAKFDPLTARYQYTKANTAWFLQDIKKARELFIKTIHLDPLNAEYLNRFAIFLARQEETAKARIAFKTSTTYDRVNAEYNYQYGYWLLAQGDTVSGLKQMEKALKLDGKYFDSVITAAIISGIEKNRIEEIIPPTPGTTIEYANFLATTGDIQKAIGKYLSALDMIETLNEQIRTLDGSHTQKIWAHYIRIFLFFQKHNDIKNAMATMQRAEKVIPADARVKLALGDLYYSQGILYKALDKYDHALLLDPGNKHAQKMIQKINP